MFADCSFRNQKHKSYVNCLTNIHIGKTNLLCKNKRQYKQRFNCISALESHLKSMHLKVHPGISSCEASVKTSVKTNVVLSHKSLRMQWFSSLHFHLLVNNGYLSVSMPVGMEGCRLCRCILVQKMTP